MKEKLYLSIDAFSTLFTSVNKSPFLTVSTIASVSACMQSLTNQTTVLSICAYDALK